MKHFCILATAVLLLIAHFHQLHAQPASVAGDTIILPTVILDSQYYTVHLKVIPATANQLFSVALAEGNFAPVIADASTFDGTSIISVPNLIYEGQSFTVQFQITEHEPLVLGIRALSLNANRAGSGGPANEGDISLNQLLSASASTQIILHSHTDALWSVYRDTVFQSMLEITVGEDCRNSDAAHFRLEALSKEEIILDDQGNSTFTLDDFDKVDVFYSEAGRPTISGGGYCPPSSSSNWTRLRETQAKDSNNNITLLDFTNPPSPHDLYHAANHGGLIYDFLDADQLPFPLTSSTQYRTLKISNLNIQLSTNDNGTNYNEATLEALNDDQAKANISVEFTDYDGSQVSISGEVDSLAGNTSIHTPLMPPGPGLAGCWLNKGVDAWCFASSTGQYIEYSVNSNPGTLYVDFTYSADVTTGSITSRNTYTRLRGSCCDTEQAITGATTNSATFQLNRNKLVLGGREYVYTDRVLGIN